MTAGFARTNAEKSQKTALNALSTLVMACRDPRA